MESNIVFSFIAVFYCFIFWALIYNTFTFYKTQKMKYKNLYIYFLSFLSLMGVITIVTLIIMHVTKPFFSNYITIFNISFWPLIIIFALYYLKNEINLKKDMWINKNILDLIENVFMTVLKIVSIIMIVIIFIAFCSNDIIENLFKMSSNNRFEFQKTNIFHFIIVETVLSAIWFFWLFIKISFIDRRNFVKRNILDLLMSLTNLTIFILLIISIYQYKNYLISNDQIPKEYLAKLLDGWMKKDYTNYMSSAIILAFINEIISFIVYSIKSIVVSKKYFKKNKLTKVNSKGKEFKLWFVKQH